MRKGRVSVCIKISNNIDPPYNTGNDFVYEDDFAQSTDEYLANSGQFDDEGNRLVKNLDSNGRFHTDWLNMIYARLRLAKDLLSDDGVIFISIDYNENYNLRKICEEIFGSLSFIGEIYWESKTKSQNTFSSYNKLQPKEEVILVYSKQIKRRFNLIQMALDESIDAKNMVTQNGVNMQQLLVYENLIQNCKKDLERNQNDDKIAEKIKQYEAKYAKLEEEIKLTDEKIQLIIQDIDEKNKKARSMANNIQLCDRNELHKAIMLYL